jgi:hypothetical protein
MLKEIFRYVRGIIEWLSPSRKHALFPAFQEKKKHYSDPCH